VSACAIRDGTRLGLAALGLIVALGPAAAPAEPVAGPRASQRTHEVKAGDTLTALAKKYGVTIAAIVKANRLPNANALLKVGRRLVIPGPDSMVTQRETAPAAGKGVGPVAVSATARAPAGLVLAVPDFDQATPPFVWPAEGPVISTFGHRRSGWHGGIDIKAPPGTLVQAAAAGIVVVSGIEARYGQVVKIEHRDGFVTVYAHNDVNLVDAGERVDAGQIIALVGRTGRATTDHLHFEIRREGHAYNPLYLLPLPPRIAQVEEELDQGPPHE